MANQKVTQLPQLYNVSLNDWLYIIDVSDTTDDPAGSSKKILVSDAILTVTGFTYSNNQFTLNLSNGSSVTSDPINTMTGLTINGGLTATTISAATYYNLPQDIYVTGGTYDSSSGVATFTNITGGTFDVTGFFTSDDDVFVTGATYSNNTFTYTNNTGGTFNVTFNTMTGLTINGDLNVTGNTVLGPTTATTISATTYYNLPDDNYWVSGSTGTFSLKAKNDSGLDATGDYAIAMNYGTLASGDYSHAEGVNTLAQGSGSHAEGGYLDGVDYMSGGTAIGDASHAEGVETIAGWKGFSIDSVVNGLVTLNSSYGDVTSEFFSYKVILDNNLYSYTTVTFSSTTNTEIILQNTTVNSGMVIADLDNLNSQYGELFYNGRSAHSEGQHTRALGVASHAEGSNTTASGTFSHSEGVDAIASGDESHAEGSNTNAIGKRSHAEGRGTTASGSASHAENAYTTASGDYSHSEGFDTISSGNSSHAEGLSTTASGQGSHSEGYLSTAIGYGSHAEGGYDDGGQFNGGLAIGHGSHAEGVFTTSIGISSHAEGYNTTSVGLHSHAEGVNTLAQGYGSHTEGELTITGWKGFSIDSVVNGLVTLNSSYGDVTSEFFSGKVIIDNEIYDYVTTTFSSTTNTEILLVDSTLNSGGYIADIGNLNSSYTDTIIRGYTAHAEGFETSALGDYSHAEGWGSLANGDQSHAEGRYTMASGANSHAEGEGTTASGTSSHAEGQGTTAGGSYSHAEGNSTKAIGLYSHAEGEDTTAGDKYTHAEGQYTKALGLASHAEGQVTKAIGNRSHAEGWETIAGCYGFNVTINNQIIILDSVYGDLTTSISVGDTLFLVSTTNTPNNVKSLGYNSISQVTFSSNTNTEIFIDSSITIPPYELLIVDNLKYTSIPNVKVGNSSHAEGYLTRTIGETSHAEGYMGTAIGAASHAEGYGSLALGDYSHAEGYGSFAGDFASHAEGSSTNASGFNTHAEGNSTQAIGDYSHAEGSGAYANGEISHAEGSGTITGWKGFSIDSVVNGLITLNSSYGDVTSQFFGYRVIIDDRPYNYVVTTFSSTTNTEILLNDTSVNSGNYVADLQNLSSVYADINIGGYVAHSEGFATGALGDYSHSEGEQTFAIGRSSHSEGNFTIARGDYSHAGGNTSVASGDTTFIHSTNSVVSGDRSVVLGGQNITGTTNDTVYVPYLNVQSATTDNSLTTLLARDIDGTIKLLTTSTISGSKPSTLNKYELTTGTTVGDNYNTGVVLSGTPVTGSYVGVEINGLGVNVGDGVTTKDCYFSSNGTAGGVRTFSTVTTGDYLVWNTAIVGYDLDNTDIITILYNT